MVISDSREHGSGGVIVMGYGSVVCSSSCGAHCCRPYSKTTGSGY